MSPATIFLPTCHAHTVLQQQALHEGRVFTDGPLRLTQASNRVVELLDGSMVGPVERQRQGAVRHG